MWFGASADDAHAFALGLLGWMLEGLDAGRRARALGALRAAVAAHTTADGVVYRSGAWLIRARRAVAGAVALAARCAWRHGR